jgi:hypothetical protein
MDTSSAVTNLKKDSILNPNIVITITILEITYRPVFY